LQDKTQLDDDSEAGRAAHRSARPIVPMLLLSKAEAAEALSMSVDHFERHVQRDLRLIRSGRLVLVPLAELQGWVEQNELAPVPLTPMG
jgi:excisionase family DNA binding protein